MQKISPLHPFILEIQQILESGDLKGQAHFHHHLQKLPKIIKLTFSFTEFLSAHQIPVYSINSFLRYSQF